MQAAPPATGATVPAHSIPRRQREIRPAPRRTVGRKVMVNAMLTATCPHCRSIEFRSVGTQSVVEKAFLWLLQPCRCDFCGHHFFIFRWQVPLGGTT